MFAPLLGGLASAAGGIAGQATAKLLGGGGQDPWEYSNQMNAILQRALDRSTNVWNEYNAKAEGSLKSSYEEGRRDLINAEKRAKNETFRGYDMARALSTPYRNAGWNAFDKYQSTLGMAIPTVSSGAVSDALYNEQRFRRYMPNGKIPTQPGARPTYDINTIKPSDQDINKYIQNNMRLSGGTGTAQGGRLHLELLGSGLGKVVETQNLQNPKDFWNPVNNEVYDDRFRNYAREQLRNQFYNEKMQPLLNQYNQQQALFNQGQNALRLSGFSPQQQQIADQYRSLFNG